MPKKKKLGKKRKAKKNKKAGKKEKKETTNNLPSVWGGERFDVFTVQAKNPSTGDPEPYFLIDGRKYSFWAMIRDKNAKKTNWRGSITTKYRISGNHIIMKATVKIIEQNKKTGECYTLYEVTGHASRLTMENGDMEMEWCETTAIGRALGHFSIGIGGEVTRSTSYEEILQAKGMFPSADKDPVELWNKLDEKTRTIVDSVKGLSKTDKISICEMSGWVDETILNNIRGLTAVSKPLMKYFQKYDMRGPAIVRIGAEKRWDQKEIKTWVTSDKKMREKLEANK